MSELDFERDAVGEVSEEKLTRLALLAGRQIQLEDRVEELERRLKEEKEKLGRVRQLELPELMHECGVSSFTLSDGRRVTVKEIVKASIPKTRQAEAFAWLREHGHGAIIKNIVAASFGRGEDEKAGELLRELVDKGLVAEQKESVHGQTLGAFVREQLAEGHDVPMELLGVYRYEEAVVGR